MKASPILPELDWDSKFLIRPLHKQIDRKALDEKPHTHNWQEIIYINKGKGVQMIDDRVIELSEKCFYIISKGQVHDFLEGENLEGFLIRYDVEFIPSSMVNNYLGDISLMFSQIWEVNSIQLQESQWPAYQRLMDCIYNEYISAHSFQKENPVVQYLFLSLMIKLLEELRTNVQINSTVKASDKRELMAFLVLVDQHFHKSHDLEFYLGQLKTDIRRLRRITKKYTGLSPKKLIVNRIMDEAKRMIQYTNNTFKEISLQLGYKDQLYFSKHFKSYTHSTPKAFRSKSDKEIKL